MQKHAGAPTGIGLFEKLRPGECGGNRIGVVVLFMLDVDVLAVGYFLGLVEAFPLLSGNLEGVRHLVRKKLLLRDVARGPICIAGDVVPLSRSQSLHGCSLSLGLTLTPTFSHANCDRPRFHRCVLMRATRDLLDSA